MSQRTYRLDAETRRHGAVVVGGSPLKVFRLTSGGAAVLTRIEAGDAVPDSKLVRRLLDAGAIHPQASAKPHRYTATDVTTIVPAFGTAADPPSRARIVDDGSTPPIPNADVRLPRNLGPAGARNAGLDTVTTPLVAFVDADVSAADDWFAELLHHFDDDDVVMVAPRVITMPDGGSIAAHDSRHSPLDLGPREARVRAGSRVSYVPAAALVARTAAVRDLGGFDEALRFGEDVDLVWRLDHSGGVVRYDPAVSVAHAPRGSWRAWASQRAAYGSSAAPLARRHPGALAPVRLSGWSVAAWLAAVAVHPAVGATISAGTGVALTRKLPDLPPSTSFRLAWRGNLHAGEQLAAAVRRAWWPLIGLAALRSRTARRILLASIIAARHPMIVADDVAYSIGVWRGMWRERTIAPITPAITSWP